MAQGRGALIRLLLQIEATYRTAPAAAAVVMPFTSWDVKRTANRQANNTINQSPFREKSNAGDPVVGGPFESIFDLRSIGYWLKLLLGAPTAGKAVTTQPVNVTGVTIHHASSDCTTGNGTLTYLSAGTTLAWTPQTGTIGTAVNVGAGGNFTLQGGGGGKSINITVNATALPVGNQNDATIAVSATLKAHAFPINTTLRPSALTEAQHSDLGKYYRVLGLKVGQLGWDVLGNEQNIRGTVMAAIETEEVAVFDANPTILTPVRACSGKGVISDGSTGLGTIVGGSVDVNNNLTGYACADGLDGYGFIDNGELAIGGTIKTVFDSAGAYALARAGTSTRMRIESAGVSGADTFKLVIDAPSVELVENAPPKTGKSGLFADLQWALHKGTDPQIYLINDVASY